MKSHCGGCFHCWLFQLWIPTRQKRFDPFWQCRVGEAAHPGPGGSRRTKRMREQKTSGAFDLGGLDLLPLLRPAIEKLLRELLNEFLSGDGLARLLGLQAAAKGELHAPPVKEKKPRKRGKKAHAPSDAKSAKPSVAPVIAPAKPAIAKPPPLPHDADGEWIEVKKPVKQTPWALRAQDWDSPLCPLDEVCKKIGEQKDEFKAVILIPNGEQKIVVENMLAGGGFKYAVLLVVLSKTEGISTTRVPGLCGAGFRFEMPV